MIFKINENPLNPGLPVIREIKGQGKSPVNLGKSLESWGKLTF